ncbi:hypothetical protein GBA52_028783 [Prunus armeniaca]|nr:hypothetical protein GBA52_028783 [Prunus armeniaca]
MKISDSTTPSISQPQNPRLVISTRSLYLRILRPLPNLKSQSASPSELRELVGNG